MFCSRRLQDLRTNLLQEVENDVNQVARRRKQEGGLTRGLGGPTFPEYYEKITRILPSRRLREYYNLEEDQIISLGIYAYLANYFII